MGEELNNGVLTRLSGTGDLIGFFSFFKVLGYFVKGKFKIL